MTLAWPDAGLPEDVRRSLVGPGGPFELVEEEVLGTVMEVFAHRPRTIVEIFRGGVERFGGRPYTVFPEREFSFESIIDPVAAVARGLQDKYGIEKGDRVGICAANCVEWVLTFWAVTALGGVTVALNGWWTGPEIAYALELTEPKVLLGDRRRLSRLEGIDVGSLPCVVFEDEFEGIESSGAGAALPEVDIDEDDPFLILFTSGTTGRPKGAMISHRSNIHFGLATYLRGAENMARVAAAGESVPAPVPPCSISASPMFHVAGLNCSLVLAPLSGQTIVYPPPGKWQEAVQLALTEKYRGTVWSLVPTQLWRLLEWPTLKDYDLTSLRTVGGGSAVWPPELLRKLEETLPWVRPGLGLGYGMTETNGLGTSLSRGDTYTRPDSIGQAAPTVQVEIRDPVTHEVLPHGEVGEIALRTAATFLGYWRNPEATATGPRRRPLVPHGRLRPCPRWLRLPGGAPTGPHHPGRREHLPDRDRESPHRASRPLRGGGGGRPPPRAGPGGQGIRGREGPRVAQRSRRRGVVRRDVGAVQGADPCRVRGRAAPQRDGQGSQAPSRLHPGPERFRTGVSQHGLR